MRVRRRITFSPPLAGPIDDRASRIAAELHWHGFTHVGRVANEVTFRDPVSARAQHHEPLREVRGGTVHLDQGGAHADVELRFSGWDAALWVGCALVAAIVPMALPYRAIALMLLLWRVIKGRRVMAEVASWVRRAAETP
jgi:hypothetical protein